MQKLKNTLENLASPEHYLFTVSDFYALFPEMNISALRVLFSRAVKSGWLLRICRGFYIYPKVKYPRGLELYHTAARFRENTFCYLSLESVLSAAGMISQIPPGWLTLMTGGRSGLIDCGQYGHIEFIHTNRNLTELSSFLRYSQRYKLWLAPAALALQDMRRARRSLDLVDRKAADELI